MKTKTRLLGFLLILVLTLGLCNSLADIMDLDEGSRTAISMIREELGEGENSTLGAAGIRIYLTGNGIDVEKYSLDVEIYLSRVIVYAKRNDGFWDACTWSDVSDEKLALLQGRFLKAYEKINGLCANDFYMVIGITGEEKGYSIESGEMAGLLYDKYFAYDPQISDERPHLADYTGRKTTSNESSNPNSMKTGSLINSVSQSFSIRNGIMFGDTKENVKEKEKFKIEEENDSLIRTKPGKVAGVEDSYVEYHFNDSGLLYDIYMDFGVHIGKNSQAEAAYNSTFKTLRQKYGAPIILDDETWYVIEGSAVSKYRENSAFLKSVDIKPVLQQYSQWIIRYDDISVMIDLIRYAPNGEGSSDVILSYRAFTTEEEEIARGTTKVKSPITIDDSSDDKKASTETNGDSILQQLKDASVVPSSALLTSWDHLESQIDESYSLFLINTNSSSFFVICESNNKTITAIQLNKLMNNHSDIGQINSMFATILTLQDDVGEIPINQNNLKRMDIAKYLKEFYDYWK